MMRKQTEAEQATAAGECIVPGCRVRGGALRPVSVVAVYVPTGDERPFLTPHKACSGHPPDTLVASYVATENERIAVRAIVMMEREWAPTDVRLRVVVGRGA